MKCPKCNSTNLVYGNDGLTRWDKEKLKPGQIVEYKCLDCKFISSHLEAKLASYYHVQDSKNILQYIDAFLAGYGLDDAKRKTIIEKLKSFEGKKITIKDMPIDLDLQRRYLIRSKYAYYKTSGTDLNEKEIYARIADDLGYEGTSAIKKYILSWKKYEQNNPDSNNYGFDMIMDDNNIFKTLSDALLSTGFDTNEVENIIDDIRYQYDEFEERFQKHFTVKKRIDNSSNISHTREKYLELKKRHPSMGETKLENMVATELGYSHPTVKRHLKNWKQHLKNWKQQLD
ncbi:hypothetical protein ACFLR3_00845 [Campylobacterota bacterium]